MNAERWKQIEEIFQATLDLPVGERENFLHRECGDDAELRFEVDKFIARFETEDTFLESPVWTDSQFLQSQIKKEIASSLDEKMAASKDRKSFIGRQIGVYRLTKELGKGGMGEVFLAERADGEFNQKVAIKLIKRGMDTDFIVKRFRHERQIAAVLNHPNIARLLDGGTTENDLPYFVMEYVEGKPFFKHAETNRLDLRGKLELFLQICRAIAYAHRKKIIHRDIKPGNILISDDGEPKLLDFGIAKILDPDLIHDSAMPRTATQMRLMTPEYASPEQIKGEEITTASDQYSLGVLLYELITGNRPYKFSSRAPHEIARVICEEIPSEPSSGAFGKFITGELSFAEDYCKKLDCIVLKSIRKNPAERYESVKEFARDIERFLRNETVRAESFAAEKTIEAGGGNVQFPPVANQQSIAVLPFKNLDAFSEHDTTSGDFLGVGLADALVTRLSNVRRLVVRPTSSVLRYAAGDADSFTAGDELKVAFLLDGNIVKSGGRVRVSVQLLNVAQQRTVWAERFDEDATDVLQLEDRIAALVAESIVPQLSGEEKKQLEKRGTDKAEAYEAYLRGRSYWNSFTEEGFRQAKFYFEKAIELDPDYVLAYTGLTDYYLWLGAYAMAPPKDCFPPARRAAERAVALDDKSAEAHSALGFARLCDAYDWEGSAQSAVRAIELNPNYIGTYLWYANHQFAREKFDEGLRLVRQAIKLDPLSFQSHNSLAYGLYFARRYDEAIEKAADNITRFPAFSLSYNALSYFLRRVGKGAESLEAADRAIELSTNLDRMPTLFNRVSALAAAGNRAEAENLLREIESKYADRHISSREYILTYSSLGEKEKALTALEKSFADGELLIWLGCDPAVDIIRNEPRYRAVARKLNLQTRSESDRKNKADGEQKSIAVLPFKNLNAFSEANTGGEDFLSVGLADALITRLSNVRQFVVRPTGSVLRFSGAEADSFAAGRDLNVRFVLDGNIIKTDKRIRVSVQLLNVSEQTTVWAERFDEDLTDVLELEDKISARVAKSLVPQMSGEERRQLEKRGTDNRQAYEAFLRGRVHWNTYTEAGFRRAHLFYQEAVNFDSQYAAAHAAIADYFVWIGVLGALPSHEAFPTAKRHALRAVELDDKLSEAHASLGAATLYGEYDWRAGERYVRRAIEINPNNAVARNWYSHHLNLQRRFDEAQENSRRAAELDSVSFEPLNELAWDYYFARRFDDALATISRVIEKFPLFGGSYYGQSNFLRAVGRVEESLQASLRSIELSCDSSTFLYGHAQALAAAGKTAEADNFLDKIKAQMTHLIVSHYQTAIVYCWSGEPEKAVNALEKALENREGMLLYFLIEPAFDCFRDDARFIEFAAKLDFIGLKPWRPEANRYTRPMTEEQKPKSPAGSPAQKSIAVLPFKMLSAGTEGATGDDAFLGVGLADALITRLSNARQIVVRPTSSVLRYNSSDADSFAAGNDLNVAFILDGTIIKSGARLRVSVQLLNVGEQSTVWAERFDENSIDVLYLEDTISARVAESIVPHLTTGEFKDIGKRGTDNAAAYEAFLRGRFHWNTFTRNGMRRAVGFYEEAIHLDPNYAHAHAAVADYYVWLGMTCYMPTDEFYPLAKRAATRAVELDSNSSEAYAALGLLEIYGGFNWTGSEKNLRRAVELNSNNAVAHNWFYHPLRSRGEVAESEKHILRALELDPTSFQNHNSYAWALCLDRRFDEALLKSEDLIEKFPQAAYAYFAKSCFLRVLGKTAEALKFARRAAELSEDGLFTYFGLAAALAADGKRAEAERIIHNPPAGYSSNYHAAEVCCILKDKERAFAFLEKAFTNREVPLIWLPTEPVFDLLRDDRRYLELLKRLNHPLAEARNVSKSFAGRTSPVERKKTSPSEAETFVQTGAMRGENIISPRRAGVKQGLFLIILSFISLPVLLALKHAAGVPGILQFAIFVCLFCAGIIRIIYAAFFESPATQIVNQSEANLSAQTVESKKSAPSKFVKYILAAVALFLFALFLYYVASHTSVDFTPTPPLGR